MARKNQKGCECPRCRGVSTANEKWGYDEKKVPHVECLMCGERIGKEPYALETSLARFGQMFFIHARCSSHRETRALHSHVEANG